MKLSIVILTWNSEKCIKSCLSSLIEYIGNEFKPYEIFIVDNGSRDTTRKILFDYKCKHPEIIKTIFLNKNKGTTFARNLAMRIAKGDIIAIFDSDIIVSKGFLKPLISLLNSSEDIGMVVPQLVYENGNYQKSTDDFPTVFTKFKRYFILKRIEKKEQKNTKKKKPFQVDYAISAFWLIKRNVYRKVGDLDEKIFYAPEDVDYCLRIWRAGYKIICEPSCLVIHNAQEISRRFKINRAMIEHLKGLFYYFYKHKYFFKKPYFV